MAFTVPYKPGLTLGEVVKNDEMQELTARSKLLKGLDLKESAYDNAKRAYRSAELLKIEANDAIADEDKGEGTDSFNEEIDKLIANLKKSRDDNLNALIKAKIAYNKSLIKEGDEEKEDSKDTGIINFEYRSPVNFEKSDLKVMPLSFDSIRGSVQYVDFEKSEQSNASKLKKLGEAGGFGTRTLFSSAKLGEDDENNSQSSIQTDLTNIKGTLVIKISTTHKNASIFSPLVFDPEQAIRTWNDMHPDDVIDPYNSENLESIAKEETKDSGKGKAASKDIKILSGVTYGSSFVAYIHTLHSNSEQTEQKVKAMEDSLNFAFKEGSWFASKSGTFGLDKDFARSIRKSLDKIYLESFFDIDVRGAIITLQSENIKTALKGFSQFDGKSNLELLAQMQNDTDSAANGIAQSANEAIRGQQLITLRNEQVKAAMLATGEIDEQNNKIIDTNTVLTSLTDYVNMAREASANNAVMGVPINFYLATLTRAEIARLWIKKFKPAFWDSIMNNTPDNTGNTGEEDAAPHSGGSIDQTD